MMLIFNDHAGISRPGAAGLQPDGTYLIEVFRHTGVPPGLPVVMLWREPLSFAYR